MIRDPRGDTAHTAICVSASFTSALSRYPVDYPLSAKCQSAFSFQSNNRSAYIGRREQQGGRGGGKSGQGHGA
jgi:hypothetical protein